MIRCRNPKRKIIMFDSLSDKLLGVFKNLRGRGKLTEQDVKEGLRTIRVALLEADVALDAVKAFMKSVREKAVGEDVIKNVRPSEMLVKIVQDELTALMGESDTSIPYREDGKPTVILMAGLQGSGKTTTCGKLGRLLSKRDGKSVMLAAADLQRPAAIDQLKTLGKQLEIPVYSEPGSTPVVVCRNAVAEAKQQNCDVLILDTAGRLHVDDDLMHEISAIQRETSPDQVFLVCDAMTGQDAVNSAKAFHEALPLDGVILTKLDSDTRGGAAVSLRHVLGRPVKFAGVGEALDKLEEFHPERMAGRILGMGDVVSLVEKAQDAVSEEEALAMQEKLLKNRFTLEDFLKQLRTIKKMGSIKDLLGMLPGIGNAMKDLDVDDKQFVRIEAIILSMTPEERNNVELLNGSRRKRIAQGAGQTVQELNQFMNQYKMMQKLFSGFSKKQGGGLMSGMKNMMGMGKGKGMPGGGAMPPGMPDMPDMPLPQEPMDKEAKKKERQERKKKKQQRKRSRGR